VSATKGFSASMTGVFFFAGCSLATAKVGGIASVFIFSTHKIIGHLFQCSFACREIGFQLGFLFLTGALDVSH